MSQPTRAIVHLDLDAFYASVEIKENPDLADKPLIIGGRYRGVVSTASYKARESGVHSAMPMTRALRLCPDAVVLPPRIGDYRKYSRRIMAILREYTPVVEQVSIDEAYLDLTDAIDQWDGAIDAARRIQVRVDEQEGLSASLGVATNKLVAKVASDLEKPGGLTVVQPGEEAAFLAPLPVRVLSGIGPVTAARLAEMRVTTVGDLARRSAAELQERFGRHGPKMARRARGIDNRPVIVERKAKSVSKETTFSHNLTSPAVLEEHLQRLSNGVARRLGRAGRVAGTVAIKLRYADFSTFTRQMALSVPTDDPGIIFYTALVLWKRTWQRGRPVRLLGVACRHLSEPAGQLPLWGDLALDEF